MTEVSAREASRGFSALLDHVEQDGEEYTVVRDGRIVARIVPAGESTVARFLGRRARSAPLDAEFAADAVSVNHLLTPDGGEPWPD